MTIVSRRLVPFAVVLAIAATLAIWMTVSAAAPRGGGPSPLPTMHFTVVPTSHHASLNGATQKAPAGATFQETAKLVSSSRQIGSAFVAATIINNIGNALLNIEARFPGRGRIELQGVSKPNGGGTDTIIGGTGIFTGAHGWAVGNNHITVTFR
jgi:hypothetical protein